jgi:hypothetical protein
MRMLQRLALAAIVALSVACSSGSTERSGGGGTDGGGSDGTVDSSQSGLDGAGDVLGSSDTGSGGNDTGTTADAMGGGDGPADAGPAGDATSCNLGYTLCNGNCVNTGNDILNCHSCGTVCPGPNPYCDNGTCTTAPCDGGACQGGMFCCGSSCCNAGQLCCDVPSNIPTSPQCTDPVMGTCPVGCPVCP